VKNATVLNQSTLNLCALFAGVGLFASAGHAVVVVDNLTGGTGTNTYPSQTSPGGPVTGMVDDIEIDGIAGGAGTFADVMIGRVQAVFTSSVSGVQPLGYRVNFFSGDPNIVRGQADGDVFSRFVPAGQFAVQPYPVAGTNGANGNFGNIPGAFLLSIDLGATGPTLLMGQTYFMSIVAVTANNDVQFSVVGSNNAFVGTPENAFQVFNPGPMGTIVPTNDNAAYRAFVIPTPGALAVGFVGLAAAARRRR
jgi:hypothetical protein